MAKDIEGFFREVKFLRYPEGVAGSLIAIIEESVKNRHETLEYAMIRDDCSYFGLMFDMEMIDIEKGTRLDLRNPSSKLLSRSRYWFLSEKAIKLHRDFAYEGYLSH
ncbi:MAG: hypothetical protein AABX26_00565 [Nanoarchaeota archaeon]